MPYQSWTTSQGTKSFTPDGLWREFGRRAWSVAAHRGGCDGRPVPPLVKAGSLAPLLTGCTGCEGILLVSFERDRQTVHDITFAVCFFPKWPHTPQIISHGDMKHFSQHEFSSDTVVNKPHIYKFWLFFFFSPPRQFVSITFDILCF